MARSTVECNTLLPLRVFHTSTLCPAAGGTVALYAQLCRTMGISPFGTMRMQDHKQVLAMRSGEPGGGGPGAKDSRWEHSNFGEGKGFRV